MPDGAAPVHCGSSGLAKSVVPGGKCKAEAGAPMAVRIDCQPTLYKQGPISDQNDPEG